MEPPPTSATAPGGDEACPWRSATPKRPHPHSDGTCSFLPQAEGVRRTSSGNLRIAEPAARTPSPGPEVEPSAPRPYSAHECRRACPGTEARDTARQPLAHHGVPPLAWHQCSPWPRYVHAPCSSLSPSFSSVSRDALSSTCSRLDDSGIVESDAPSRAEPGTHPREALPSTTALPVAAARPARPSSTNPELAAKLTHQRIYQAPFHRLRLFVVSVHTATARCRSHVHPVRRQVARPLVTLPLHKRLEQYWPHTVRFLPIINHHSGCQRQHVTRKAFDGKPRQDQEPTVVDHPHKILLPRRVIPTDEAVTRLKPTRRRRELHASTQFTTRFRNPDQIPQVCAIGHLVAKVVVSLDQFPPQRSLLSVRHQAQNYRRHVREIALSTSSLTSSLRVVDARGATTTLLSTMGKLPVVESPGAVRIGHPERSHLVEYLAPNSVFNSLPRQRSSPHLGPDDRFVTVDRVLHHASLRAA